VFCCITLIFEGKMCVLLPKSCKYDHLQDLDIKHFLNQMLLCAVHRLRKSVNGFGFIIDHIGIHNDLAQTFKRWQIVHRVEQHFFQDRA